MAEIKVSRVTALPGTLEASTIYIVQHPTDAALAELVFTNNDGSAARHILNKADVAAMIAAAVGGGGGGVADSALKLETARLINGVAFDGTADIVINAVDATPRIAESEKGAVNGVATLGSDGRVPANQLPSYVDDVVEVATESALPVTGEAEKIYIVTDTNTIFRWSGSQYVAIEATAGSADTAVKLVQARTIEATGDVSWQVSFDGSQNVSGVASLANSGISAGEHAVATYDAKGRAVSGRALVAADIPMLDSTKVVSAQGITLVANEW